MDTDRTRDNTPVSVEVELPKRLYNRAKQAGIDLSDILTKALEKHLGIE